ncbi:hypothetical protein TrST_g10482 [Triparma strigata]|uniref:Calmodulin n=2 Tax=Triparma strigata TaxID=1606541 RepID=A0A9W7AI46_9STRA|nr:hypothetical protein TrST_g10482 [Triparma strigata]
MGCLQSKPISTPSPVASLPNNVTSTPVSLPVTPESSTHRLTHSSSRIGLDTMLENQRASNFARNVVHIEDPTLGRKIEEVYANVHTGKIIGSGVSGVVREVTHRSTGVLYAAKCLDLDTISTAFALEQLKEEVHILIELDHPNIVRLEEVYESPSEIFLVFERLSGGELFDRLDEQPDYHYSEYLCKDIIRQVLCAIRYCHSKGIIHRDLKLENFIFESYGSNAKLKLIDFGLSKHFTTGDVQKDAVGTPYTVAPEVIRGRYDEGCDVWAVGVIAYLLLSGETPFGGCGGESLSTVRNNILSGELSFQPESIWSNVSPAAKLFICSLLQVDPTHRPTVQQAQDNAWFHTTLKTAPTLSPAVVQSLINFRSYDNLRKLIHEIISFTLLQDQIVGLRGEFEKVDTDGLGEISFGELKKVLEESAAAGNMGSLREDEIVSIFNSLKVSQSSSTIHYHEFIAACLSQCELDDRNLRLAFERMDAERKGYISADNIADLLGADATEGQVEGMFKDARKSIEGRNFDKISFEDFVRLMNGQSAQIKPGNTTAPPAQTEEAVPVIGVPDAVKRARSRSAGSGEETKNEGSYTLFNVSEALKKTRENSGGVLVLKGENGVTPLKESRRIYRSHREMRIAIFEASKRFEAINAKRNPPPPASYASAVSGSARPLVPRGRVTPTLTMSKTPIRSPRGGGSVTSNSESKVKIINKTLSRISSGSGDSEADHSIQSTTTSSSNAKQKVTRGKRIRVMSDMSGMMSSK